MDPASLYQALDDRGWKEPKEKIANEPREMSAENQIEVDHDEEKRLCLAVILL